MERTLLLDQGYLPITIIPWTRAISMLWIGKVEVVEEYEREVHSPSFAMRLPAVVRLIKRIRRGKRKIKFSRHNIYLRDGGKCQYCSTSVALADSTFDHVTPRSKGGKTHWENIVIACQKCNLKKANRTPQQARMQLRKQPRQPKDIPYVIFKLRTTSTIPLEWRDYLASISYWTSALEMT
jgi:5-methylcytosine-specific restriction endonuclease McrA